MRLKYKHLKSRRIPPIIKQRFRVTFVHLVCPEVLHQAKGKVNLSLCLTNCLYFSSTQSHKNVRESEIIAPDILNLGVRCRWVKSCTPSPLYPRRKRSHYPMDRRRNITKYGLKLRYIAHLRKTERHLQLLKPKLHLLINRIVQWELIEKQKYMSNSIMCCNIMRNTWELRFISKLLMWTINTSTVIYDRHH
jgi:hypothetical protein